MLLFFRYLTIALYTVICLVSLLFTFFVDKYQCLSELLESEIVQGQPLTILESSKVNVDEWLLIHHKGVGPVLFLLSFFDGYMLNKLLLLLQFA